MKKVLMLGTGGTIASDITGKGLAPKLTTEELLAGVPEVSSLCKVTCQQLFSIDSTNLTPSHWLLIAQAIRENFGKYDGFVIRGYEGTEAERYRRRPVLSGAVLPQAHCPHRRTEADGL